MVGYHVEFEAVKVRTLLRPIDHREALLLRNGIIPLRLAELTTTVGDDDLLSVALLRESPPMAWSEASVYTRNSFLKSGCARIGADIRRAFSSSNALASSSPQCHLHFLLVSRDNGAAILAYSGMNRR